MSIIQLIVKHGSYLSREFASAMGVDIGKEITAVETMESKCHITHTIYKKYHQGNREWHELGVICGEIIYQEGLIDYRGRMRYGKHQKVESLLKALQLLPNATDSDIKNIMLWLEAYNEINKEGV